MKKLLLFIILSSISIFSQIEGFEGDGSSSPVFFYHPEEGQVYLSGVFGHAEVPWALGLGSGYSPVILGCTLRVAGVDQYKLGGNGTWNITKAGNHKLQGYARVSDLWGQISDHRTIWINITVIDNHPPSVPSNLHHTRSSNNHPLLAWDANYGFDMSYYKIYKSRDGVTDWQYIGQTANTQYEDLDETMCVRDCFDFTYKYYRITAIDINDNDSGPSNVIAVQVTGSGIEKGKTIWSQALENYLDQNHPNPFNPTTSISYQLKQNGMVSLTIYDMLGNEVAKLVNEEQETGFYTVSFNASQLSSGVYVYVLMTNNFIQSRKLILMK